MSSTDPDDLPPEARQLARRAHGLAEAGALAEALVCFDRALALAPPSAELNFYRASLLHRMDRPADALAGFERSVALEPHAPVSHLALGGVLMTLDRPAEALEVYDRLLAAWPDLAMGHANRADTLRTLGRAQDAADSAGHAIALDPEDPVGFLNRGAALLDLGRYEEALADYDRAIALDARLAQAHSNRANALRGLERLDEALASADRALALKPHSPPALHSRATVLTDMGRYIEARDLFAAARQLAPDAPAAAFGAAYVHLLLGEYAPGWELMEARWTACDPDTLIRPRDITRPLWLGGPLKGKTILLRGEQGVGDVIQFCRYVPMVKALGARVILEVEPSLTGLMASLEGIDRIVLTTEPLPDFDVYCPLMSLPLAFATEADSIPAAVPYLAAQPDKVRRWRDRLGERRRLRIGLVWAGAQRHQPLMQNVSRRRNIPLAALAPLAEVDADFHSLQKGPEAEDELRALRASGWAGPAIADHAAELADLTDTAALIQSLDAVVSVCTSMAHLSGALGKPTFILLHAGACWRWMQDRSDSPWYPTAELLRQPDRGDWPGVARQLIPRLQALTVPPAAP